MRKALLYIYFNKYANRFFIKKKKHFKIVLINNKVTNIDEKKKNI